MATIGTAVRTKRRLAWAAPVVVTVVLAGAALGLSSIGASAASPHLPTRTAAQLLAEVKTNAATAFSATMSETASLGIPALPGGHASASLSWQNFISGTHTARVWSDGTAKQRLALVGELSEADVIHNGNNLWTYTSDTNTVTHSTLPAKSASRTPSAAEATPSAIANSLLNSIDPSTAVTVGATESVAGHAAYTLVLKPRDARSTVRKVNIAIDAARWLPLRVQVFGSGSAPAFTIGFTAITYGHPAASTFAFTPPKGAIVSTDPLGSGDKHGEAHRKPASKATTTPANTPKASAEPKVVGTGWTSVLELPNSGGVLNSSTVRDLTAAVGTSGARLLHTALINVLIRPDGRTFVGAVRPSLLEHVAATTR